jgi:hypothetical protein
MRYGKKLVDGFVQKDKLEYRASAGAGVCALLLSSLLGFASGNDVPLVFLRAFVFSLVFAGIVFAGFVVLRRFVPELYEVFGAGDEAETVMPLFCRRGKMLLPEWCRWMMTRVAGEEGLLRLMPEHCPVLTARILIRRREGQSWASILWKKKRSNLSRS